MLTNAPQIGNSSNEKRPRISRHTSGTSLSSAKSQPTNTDEAVSQNVRNGEIQQTSTWQGNGGNSRPPSNLYSRPAEPPQEDRRSGLPAEKGFPIQIGSELFRLSGSSIMSDCQS